ncbi:MAG: hypothetical protein A4E42_00204 [Methanoregulaceae archaeon PtaU1.Bin222]|nr:MAG: hypothetical protein A4E42_00204 [Methanoregulaceae archaeon PtaU1.Bin222]
MSDPLFVEGPWPCVLGIAIYPKKKWIEASHGSPDDTPLFEHLHYYKDTVKQKITPEITRENTFRVYCKIFNPDPTRFPYTRISGLIFPGQTLGIESHLMNIKDYDDALIYPEVLSADRRRRFHHQHLEPIESEFPSPSTSEGTKSFFFFKYFDLDYRYPQFYDTDEPFTLVFRISGSRQSNEVGMIFPEQQFTWIHHGDDKKGA